MSSAAITDGSTTVTQPSKGYPKGIMSIFFVQLFFMVGFMMIFSLLVLYLTNQMGFSDKHAYTIFAAYGSLVYGLPLLGGYLGERCFGYKHAVWSSLCLGALGLFVLSIPSKGFMYFGLACFVMGTGIATPCLYVLLGRLFPEGVKGRDSGFTLVYIGVNVGALLAGFSSGLIQEHWGFSTAFIIGGVSMMLAVLFYFVRAKEFFEDPIELKQATSAVQMAGFSVSAKLLGYIAIVIVVFTSFFLMEHASLCNILLVLVGVLAALLVVFLALREKAIERKKMLVFLALGGLSLAFWVIYMLAPSALTIFVERNVMRHIDQWMVPTSSIIGLDPFFIVTIGPLLTYLWLHLSRKGQQIIAPTKIAMGVTSAGIGYLILVFGIYCANTLGYTALYWVVICYFFTTVAELLVVPIGFSMVGRLVPRRYEGLMMGVWQLGTGFASAISGYLAKATSVDGHVTVPLVTNQVFRHAFGIYGLTAVIVGCIAIALIPRFKAIMQLK